MSLKVQQDTFPVTVIVCIAEGMKTNDDINAEDTKTNGDSNVEDTKTKSDINGEDSKTNDNNDVEDTKTNGDINGEDSKSNGDISAGDTKSNGDINAENTKTNGDNNTEDMDTNGHSNKIFRDIIRKAMESKEEIKALCLSSKVIHALEEVYLPECVFVKGNPVMILTNESSAETGKTLMDAIVKAQGGHDVPVVMKILDEDELCHALKKENGPVSSLQKTTADTKPVAVADYKPVAVADYKPVAVADYKHVAVADYKPVAVARKGRRSSFACSFPTDGTPRSWLFAGDDGEVQKGKGTSNFTDKTRRRRCSLPEKFNTQIFGEITGRSTYRVYGLNNDRNRTDNWSHCKMPSKLWLQNLLCIQNELPEKTECMEQ